MRVLLLVIFFFCLLSFAYSQPGDPGGGGKPGVPITGIEYLIGLGGLFGARKIMKSLKKTK